MAKTDISTDQLDLINAFKFGNLTAEPDEVKDDSNAEAPDGDEPNDNDSPSTDKTEKPELKEDTPEKKEEPSDTQTEPDQAEEEPFATLALEISKYSGFDVELEDLQEIMKENSIDGFMNFINAIIDENKPTYASEVSAQFDEFVANGGNPKEFFENNFLETSYKNVNLEELGAEDKKKLIADYQKKTTDFSQARIDKLVSKLEEDEINEMAEEALVALQNEEQKRAKEFESKQKERVEQQKAQALQQQKAREEFLKSSIKNSSQIAGFDINKTQKERFEKFMLEPSEIIPEINPSTGKPTGRQIKVTPYQKTILEDKELEIKLAYLMFLGGNKKELAKFVEDENVKKIKTGFSKKTSDGSKNTSVVDPPPVTNPGKDSDSRALAGKFSLRNLA